MPRYFFDIIDGRPLRDDAGVELDTPADARAQAVIALAGAVMPEQAIAALKGDRWRVEVRAQDGPVLFTLEYREGGAA